MGLLALWVAMGSAYAGELGSARCNNSARSSSKDSYFHAHTDQRRFHLDRDRSTSYGNADRCCNRNGHRDAYVGADTYGDGNDRRTLDYRYADVGTDRFPNSGANANACRRRGSSDRVHGPGLASGQG
jgi:hypothetical protein